MCFRRVRLFFNTIKHSEINCINIFESRVQDGSTIIEFDLNKIKLEENKNCASDILLVSTTYGVIRTNTRD